MKISVVIPIYNEEDNVAAIYRRLDQAIQKVSLSKELIFVNDGSTDRSFSIIQRLASDDRDIKYIDLSRNFGHQIAVTAGLEASTGNAVIVIDADLQDPPELIPQMISKWQEGYHVVYAKRNKEKASRTSKFGPQAFFTVCYRGLPDLTYRWTPETSGL